MEYVSDNFFYVLGATPALGRAFTPEENRTPGGEPVVILSYGLWQRRFGGDPKILGLTMRMGNAPRVIIGVMARDFVGFGELENGELESRTASSRQSRALGERRQPTFRRYQPEP